MNKYCDANYVNLQAKNCAENKYCYIIITVFFFLDNLIPLTNLKVETFARALDCVEMFQTFSQRIFEDPRNLSITLVAPDRSDI